VKSDGILLLDLLGPLRILGRRRKLLNELVDLIGIEPMTSSMPFHRVEYIELIPRNTTRHRIAAFMRPAWDSRAFICCRVTWRETVRHGQGSVGYDTSRDTTLSNPHPALHSAAHTA
jgi:hypothetical protein